MKRILPVIFAILSSGTFGQINYVDVTPTFGYHFGGRARFYEGDIKIQDAATYGITLSVPVAWGVSGELSWSRSDSKANFYPIRPEYEEDELEMATNYFLIGGMKEMGEGPAKAFGGFTLGMAWFDSKESRVDDIFRFSISLGAGVKYMVSDRIGLRLQGRFLVPIYFAGGGIFCGIGGGGSSCGVSVGGGSTILQGDISAGLIFRLGATE
ncbi:hypothetical protein ES705_18469 [subsurface metagenome]